MWPRVVVLQLEIFVLEAEDIFYVRIDFHGRQRTGSTCQLEVHLLQVVQVDVGISERMDEVTRFQFGHLCHHLQQQGIGGDVERYAQKGVRTALVHLQAQSAVGHIELKNAWHGGRFMWFKSPTFQALTMVRRESGLCLMVSTASEIWSMNVPS